ncbi:MAG: hypothetical protein ACREL3_07855 [Gemmatimonadales bacterium]
MPAAIRRLTAFPLLLLAAGCFSNFGPGTVPAARFDYNQRIAQSWNEQLLLNLVRLRYRDTPYFLEVGTVLAQYQIVRHASAAASIGVGGGEGSAVGPSIGADFAESPTITYQPLQGEEFVRRLLEPVPGETLMLLAGSGWSVERLLICCVNAINGIANVPSAAGPTPSVARVDPRFRSAARLLRRLQSSGRLQPVRGPGGQPEGRVAITPPDSTQPADTTTLDSLASLLRLDRAARELDITVDQGVERPAELRLRLRSLLGAMFYLSQAVDVPEGDARAGLVTTSQMPDGTAADWPALMGGIFRVRSSETRPNGAFTSVRYRGHWFYIDDADLESKTTFGLLLNLFSLQSAQSRAAQPLLTVPAGQ